MATHLQELLRSVCVNTEWNYAVFWKLKHRARMVLTWEDAFYNNPFKIDPSNKSFGEAFESLNEGHITQDPLGMAIAKMSYHVYSLGEGIVGQVAVTGKHRWIFANEQAMSCSSPLEICDGWQAQFAAGIKTIVVAAVVPDGVVQLGSLNKVNENVQLLTNIRHAFSSLQDSTCHIQTPIHASLQNVLQMSEIHMRNFGPNNLQECLLDLDKTTNNENTSSSAFDIQSCVTENSTLYDAKQISEGNTEKMVVLDSMEKLRENYNVESQPESTMFSGGTELYEALGPGFMKQSYPFSWESEKPEKERLDSQIPKGMENSLITTDFGTDHLLEAVVANFCKKDVGFKSEKSFSTSESMLTTEKMQESSINTSYTIGSSSYYSIGCSSLLEENTRKCLNSSDSCSLSFSTSGYKEPLVKPVENSKTNKKRARPGESSRPRPRDRQLIQDRIKELRELVPNGSKCSIDSLLERTIKHMVFMQSVTKHADKLNSSVKSRGCSNEMGVLGSSYKQGSSWAVEVGGHMKICPIVVENLNVNGQMLIEMLCEDCDHFLEITEAIRSLGLTILKGMTDNHGDKTWMRFVVESQSNRNLHRMDVLWSLVQLLQSKTIV